MSNEKIKRRKKELQTEIDLIEDKYIRQAADIERKVKTALKPVQNIRTKPFVSVGISIALGFSIGFIGKKKKKEKKKSQPSYQSDNSDNGGISFTKLFLAELKRLAAQRAMMYVSEVLDKKVMPNFTTNNKKEASEQTREFEKDVHERNKVINK